MNTLFPLVTSILTPLLVTLPVRAAALPFSDLGSAAQQLRISVVDREPGSVPAGSTAAKGFTVLVADPTGAPVADSAVVFRFPDDGPSGSLPDASHSAIVYTSADGLARISGIKWGNTPGPVAIKIMATKGEARAGILLMEALTAQPAVDAVPAAQPAQQPAPAVARQQQTQQQPAVPATHAAPPKVTPTDTTITVDKTALQPPSQTRPSIAEPPAVSVTNGKTASAGYHSSHKKWIILAAVVAAAAGAGVALGAKGKSSSTASTSGVSVGTPTVSVGQP